MPNHVHETLVNSPWSSLKYLYCVWTVWNRIYVVSICRVVHAIRIGSCRFAWILWCHQFIMDPHDLISYMPMGCFIATGNHEWTRFSQFFSTVGESQLIRLVNTNPTGMKVCLPDFTQSKPVIRERGADTARKQASIPISILGPWSIFISMNMIKSCEFIWD